MGDRTVASSEIVEYDTSTCIHCDDEVFVDEELENVDKLPRGINVAIGGGEHISVESTSLSARNKNYRIPRVVVKWFGGNEKGEMVETQHMCPSCAESIYGFNSGD